MLASDMLELLVLTETDTDTEADADAEPVTDADVVADVVDMELLLAFLSIGGRLKLSLLEDERLLGSFDSIS